jgi:hypothetical protein
MVQELRTANRYRLTAVVFFSWRNPDGRRMHFKGVTRDISMQGVCFLTASNIALGAYIELDVYLPSLNGRTRGMKLHGQGTVVRVESVAFEKRVAAEVLFDTEPEATLIAASLIQ